MRPGIYFTVWCLVFFSSCGVRQREIELEKKMQEVNQKEQQLLLKEKTLELREQELVKRESAVDTTTVDSLQIDSAFFYNEAIVGSWTVRMTCTETTCSGSAVGDTKTEHWEIGYQDNAIVARARAGNQLVRVYTGRYYGDMLQLTAQQEDTTKIMTRMIVRIQEVKANEMQGRREIIREGDCRITYRLDLKKN